MEEIVISIGEFIYLRNGAVQDTQRRVHFTGEKIGCRTVYGEHNGRPTDTRGTTETLYRTIDNRLIVHVSEWSQWQNESNTETIREVSMSDLQPGGDFEFLGQACGLGRLLTIDEALGMSES